MKISKYTNIAFLTLIFSTLFSSSIKTLAQRVPHDSMPTYEQYKQELLDKNWQPVPQEFSATTTGEYDELICGTGLCTAYWQHNETGETLEFIIWRSSNGLVVAPYLSPDN
jgi:hypothetical protein